MDSIAIRAHFQISFGPMTFPIPSDPSSISLATLQHFMSKCNTSLINETEYLLWIFYISLALKYEYPLALTSEYTLCCTWYFLHLRIGTQPYMGFDLHSAELTMKR